jgi:response regulator RpfG family c-di-GMP phosphodiesterase
MPTSYNVPAVRAACERVTAPTVRPAAAPRPWRPERILVVDDRPQVTEIVREQLSSEGFAVTTTNHSDAVMGMLDQGSYDLILLDIDMPPPDGLTLLSQIHARDPLQAVVMLTGYGDAGTAARAMRDGAADYVVKPYEHAQLIARIERALERSELLHERAASHALLEQRVAEQTHALHEQSQQLSLTIERVLNTYGATLHALEAALDVRDRSAPGHCRRVARMAVELGTHMRLSERELTALEHGALLHDIGKLGIPDTILLKPGPLDADEQAVMRQHPKIGCDIVGHIGFLSPALPIIRHHHERYDGTGYPDGLAGADIPRLARVFSVVDAVDAQTHMRPYNAIRDQAQVHAELRRHSGTQFDPFAVEQYIAMSSARPLRCAPRGGASPYGRV